jgi:hypothetical protein
MSHGPLNSTEQQLERAEAEAVLAAEMFKRAPSLRQILAYVCKLYFDGEASKIKEYNIAVEALGRGADFDPNEETIVRVEASRLRKRLREYYLTEGASHSIQLCLPKTGYVPQFIARPAREVPSDVRDAEGPAAGSQTTVNSGWRSRKKLLGVTLAAALFLAIAAVFLLFHDGGKSAQKAEQVRASRTTPPAQTDAIPGEATAVR